MINLNTETPSPHGGGTRRQSDQRVGRHGYCGQWRCHVSVYVHVLREAVCDTVRTLLWALQPDTHVRGSCRMVTQPPRAVHRVKWRGRACWRHCCMPGGALQQHALSRCVRCSGTALAAAHGVTSFWPRSAACAEVRGVQARAGFHPCQANHRGAYAATLPSPVRQCYDVNACMVLSRSPAPRALCLQRTVTAALGLLRHYHGCMSTGNVQSCVVCTQACVAYCSVIHAALPSMC